MPFTGAPLLTGGLILPMAVPFRQPPIDLYVSPPFSSIPFNVRSVRLAFAGCPVGHYSVAAGEVEFSFNLALNENNAAFVPEAVLPVGPTSSGGAQQIQISTPGSVSPPIVTAFPDFVANPYLPHPWFEGFDVPKFPTYSVGVGGLANGAVLLNAPTFGQAYYLFEVFAVAGQADRATFNTTPVEAVFNVGAGPEVVTTRYNPPIRVTSDLQYGAATVDQPLSDVWATYSLGP